jgi:hypothetical protein
MNLPIPTKHPWERIMERVYFEHPFDLFPFICQKCGDGFMTEKIGSNGKFLGCSNYRINKRLSCTYTKNLP